MKKSGLVCTAAVTVAAAFFALWINETRAQAQQAQAAPAQPAAGGRGALPPGIRDPFAGGDFAPHPPVLPLSPAEEQKKFILYPGFHLEPVLADPDIEEPMAFAFDGNGRMFVLEMRSYMQDKDARGELDPISRISLHTDTKGTGIYDKHTVFLDHLVVPRFVLPFGPNAILVMESNSDEVYKYTDTNGDGVADKKEFFTSDFGRAGNIEHQPGALFNAMDNWLYSTVNAVRIRWKPNGTVIRENTGSNGGQWGAGQDNYGKTYFTGGASGVPSAVQFPIVYGSFNVPDQLEPGLNETWGAAIKIADMQGGMNAVRMPDGSLNAATAGAGGMIYRGDRLPADMIGDYFYGEIVGRIVRRLRPVVTEGLTQMKNIYQAEKSEFIRTTDPLFRPVFQANAPDGTIYISDAYRGIVQEYQWSGPGTYLRRKVEQYQLDKVVRHGRIWRLTYDGMGRDKTAPRMNDETSAQLVAHLSHPNGWWRDTAQQLLVLKQDKTVVPALKDLAKSSGNQLARVHALWTLEGLNSLDAATVRQFMSDSDPKIRMTGIRVSEALYKSGDHSFEADWKTATKDKDTDVAIQALLTTHLIGVEGLPELIQGAEDVNKARGIKFVGDTFLNPNPNAGGFFGAPPPRVQSADTKELMIRGKAVYEELCYTCHGDDGRGSPVEAGKGVAGTTKAPSLAGSPRVVSHRDYVIKAIMYGLTGPIDGKNYTEQMVPNGGNKDIWVAAVANYVRNSFGNNAGFVTVDDVARIRAANPGRVLSQAREESGAPKTRFTIPRLQASLPRLIAPQMSWKATASVNNDDAAGGFSLARWSTGTTQKPGMWYQVELPQPTTFTEIQFDSPRAGESGGKGNPTPNGPGTFGFALAGASGAGRGGRGRGGPAAPPAPLGVPVAYKVEVSLNASTWTTVAEGKGESDTTNITLKPTRAKFIRITQTGDAPNAPGWNMERFRLYGPPAMVMASTVKPAAKPVPVASK